MFFPNGSLLASAGVNDIRIWDLIAGKLLAKFNPHNKTVTCLGMAMNNSRLVTGSLDRQVRPLIVDWSILRNFQVSRNCETAGVNLREIAKPCETPKRPLRNSETSPSISILEGRRK